LIRLKKARAGVAAANERNEKALWILLNHGIVKEARKMWTCPIYEEYEGGSKKSRDTALRHQCIQRRVECVNLLLDWGADILAKDKKSRSYLRTAQQHGRQAVV
jgi:ankyrin repeat protein